MKILYIGPYRQSDGWGEASKDFVFALLKSKHDIYIKPVYMSSNIGKFISNEEIEQAEAKYSANFDIVIQHVLPTMFVRHGSFKKNIGMFFSETNNLQHTPWPYQCNLMDEIIVSSNTEKNSLINSGVKTPIKIIPIPVNVNKFEKAYEKLNLPRHSKTFNFYFIGEYTQRKNINALILAFQLEFKKYEPVNLIIKTNKTGIHPIALQEKIRQDILQIKQAYRVYATMDNYKSELIITDYLDEENMCRLHASCDCFVMPSHGEAWCKPAIDAMGFGNTPIVTDNTGMTQFVNDKTGWIIPSIETTVMCIEPPIPYIYTAHETWQNISIPHLRAAMREAYNNKILKNNKREAGINEIYNYSYTQVAKILNEYN